ncbi:hypothetical protein [Leptospira adleri]|uniref:Uncharacterized protein n=1 Tax=Leptospira adleri TaxID=2023186 RepID=A0A2M9YJ60_9LEPT|nr:hypothetical protein [Leptospira adleri]PJZ51581.1 hypothetical protein CH380_19235 [Leptospira adleri]PJZ61910.1 hypothetical protein CH376_10930 [Leptospira adleri]
MFEDLLKALGLGVCIGVYTFVKHLYDKWVEKKAIENNKKKSLGKIELVLNINSMVQDRLALLRDHYSASRAKVFQFHNGEYYLNGAGVEKFSMSHISVKPGMAVPYNFEEYYTKKEISMSVELIKPICDSSFYYLKTDDLPETSRWRRIFRFNDIKAHLFAKIDYQGFAEGFISISWHDDLEHDTDPTEIIRAAEEIGLLLRTDK